MQGNVPKSVEEKNAPIALNNFNEKPFFRFIFSIFFYSQRDIVAKNADDVLFDMFRNESTDLLPVGKFLAVS